MTRRGFGSLDAVNADWLIRMPATIQAEGLALMLEAGAGIDDVCRRMGWSADHVGKLVSGSHLPFRRGGDVEIEARGV